MSEIMQALCEIEEVVKAIKEDTAILPYIKEVTAKNNTMLAQIMPQIKALVEENQALKRENRELRAQCAELTERKNAARQNGEYRGGASLGYYEDMEG